MIFNKIIRDDNDELIFKIKKLPTELIIKIYSYTIRLNNYNKRENIYLKISKQYMFFGICISLPYSIGLGITKIPFGHGGEFIIINSLLGSFIIVFGGIIIYNCCIKECEELN